MLGGMAWRRLRWLRVSPATGFLLRLTWARLRRRISPLAVAIALLASLANTAVLRFLWKVFVWGIDKAVGDTAYKSIVKAFSWGIGVMSPLSLVYRHWNEITQVIFWGAVVWVAIDSFIKVRRERKTKRIIAEMQAIPKQDKGTLDFGAAIEEGFEEIKRIAPQIAGFINDLGSTATRHAKLLARGSTFTQKRQRAEDAADDFDRIASRLAPVVSEFESANGLLQDNWVELLRGLDNPSNDIVGAGMAHEIGPAVESSVLAVAGFRATIDGIHSQRMSQRLNESMIRLLLLVDRIRNASRGTADTVAEVVARGAAARIVSRSSTENV